MNAYELADKLIAGGGDYMMNIGFMLRQQADRIAELEKQLTFMEGEYPEPTIVQKMQEFASLEQALNRIAELESKLNGAAVVTGSVMTQLSTMAHPSKIFDEVLYTVQTFREDQDPPHKEWENTYMDGWLDACNEIYNAVFDLKEEMLELKESDSDAEDDDGRC